MENHGSPRLIKENRLIFKNRCEVENLIVVPKSLALKIESTGQKSNSGQKK